MSRIYISKSINIKDDSSYFGKALAFLKKKGMPYFQYWRQDAYYDPQILYQAEVMFVLLPEKCTTAYIGKGTVTEIHKCEEKGIPVYIMYFRKCDETFQFYRINNLETYENTDNWNQYGMLSFGNNITHEILNAYGEESLMSKESCFDKETIEVVETNDRRRLLLL